MSMRELLARATSERQGVVVGTPNTNPAAFCNPDGMEISPTIGKRIAALRRGKKITQQEAAVEIGIERSTLAGIEADKSQPGRETLGAIADFFGVSRDYLVTGTPILRDDLPGETVKDEDEASLLRLWRLLDDGKRQAVAEIMTGLVRGDRATRTAGHAKKLPAVKNTKGT